MEQSRGLLRVIPNDELVRREQQARAAQQQAEKDKEQVLSGLSAHVLTLWEDAKRAKNVIRPRLLQALRQRRGEYDPDKLTEIRKTGGSEIYMMISSVKCRAGCVMRSWVRVTTNPGPSHPHPTPSCPMMRWSNSWPL